jgi:hypothetical protein
MMLVDTRYTRTSRAERGPTALNRLLWLGALFSASTLLGGCRTVVDPAAIRDAQTAAQIKTALVNDQELGSSTIEVTVAGGVARLAGTVRTQAEADRAAALARGVEGVRGVDVALQIGGEAASPGTDPPPAPPLDEVTEVQDDPRLLAVGASFGWSDPSRATLRARTSVGPLVRLGSGRGLGPALALGWFHTSVTATSAAPDLRSRIHVRPLMGGVGYTFASSRLSVAPSLVGGVAFNSVTVPTSGVVDRVAVEVGNSLVWRPGVSMWVDVSRRAAVNVSAGYVVMGLRVTFLEDGRLVQQDVRGNATVVHAGLAYKLF